MFYCHSLNFNIACLCQCTDNHSDTAGNWTGYHPEITTLQVEPITDRLANPRETALAHRPLKKLTKHCQCCLWDQLQCLALLRDFMV